VPIIAFSKSVAKVPRCAPASLPCATMASTPLRSSAMASSTVVAVPMRYIPRAFTVDTASVVSNPKVKLNAAAPVSSAAPSWSSKRSVGDAKRGAGRPSTS
jgi:hypothetical protein